MVKLMYVKVLPHQIQKISLKSVCEKQPPVFGNMRSEPGTICNLSCIFRSLPHHPGNGLSPEFICVITKNVTDQLCSQTRLLRRYLSQVDLEGKLMYLGNTWDFHGRDTVHI